MTLYIIRHPSLFICKNFSLFSANNPFRTFANHISILFSGALFSCIRSLRTQNYCYFRIAISFYLYSSARLRSLLFVRRRALHIFYIYYSLLDHVISHFYGIYMAWSTESDDRRRRQRVSLFSAFMSLDLAWDKLDSSLTGRLVDILNKHLSTVERPSFIGPIEITGFDFGTVCPDIEVVDMCDIYRDFLEDDEEDALESVSQAPTKGSEGLSTGVPAPRSFAKDEDDYEWVPRREAQRAYANDVPAYHHMLPHLRYGRGPASDTFSAPPGMLAPRDLWGGIAMSTPNLAHLRPGLTPLQSSVPSMAASMYGLRTPSFPHSATSIAPKTEGSRPAETPLHSSPARDTTPAPPADAAASTAPPPNPSAQPDLQLHLHVLHHSDLRLSLTTSLLINYPSPQFMALPIKLAVTGFVFDGEVVLAYEGRRKRVHLCVLDELDPYGPASARRNRGSSASSPVEAPEDSPFSHPAKPLPVGQRLLPSIAIESEIGQADKHVLRNVTRVERFIQDVIRKTIVDELVFPNFHTLILGE